MGGSETYPVHSRVTVHDAVDIYKTEQWWKAAVKHSIGADADDSTLAIYLWHNDGDDWTRKNKYNIKTADAWAMDKQLIKLYLSDTGQDTTTERFPTSDYYNVARGETVFKTDEWWKAIVIVDRKGDYETHEVIIYLWQRLDGTWRRRQKYAIKDNDDWADDRTAIERIIDEPAVEPHTPSPSEGSTSTEPEESTIAAIAKEFGIEAADDDLSALHEELEDIHLAIAPDS